MKQFDPKSVIKFIQSLHNVQFQSVPGGPLTLYGTSYALLTQYYLTFDAKIDANTKLFIRDCQITTGEFVGPELQGFEVQPGVLHNREHLMYHLTCTVLPVCSQFNIPIRYPLSFAHSFCDVDYLTAWLNARDLTLAWFEGNNMLFVGQLLVYLRDVEHYPGAVAALQCWFDWLDTHADPATGLWGTNGYCNAAEAVYGGYHQLLVYYHEDHTIPNPQGLVDTVLSLQHYDGGFHPSGNGGACEDVDCVDILVNMYKRFDYRRSDIRIALRRCLQHILILQNPDGGFPYNRNQPQSHMGIPGTFAPPNVSTAFATWFRVHTLALIAQVLSDEPTLQGVNFRFTNTLSMGWHRTWSLEEARQVAAAGSVYRERVAGLYPKLGYCCDLARRMPRRLYHAGRKRAGKLLRQLRF